MHISEENDLCGFDMIFQKKLLEFMNRMKFVSLWISVLISATSRIINYEIKKGEAEMVLNFINFFVRYALVNATVAHCVISSFKRLGQSHEHIDAMQASVFHLKNSSSKILKNLSREDCIDKDFIHGVEQELESTQDYVEAVLKQWELLKTIRHTVYLVSGHDGGCGVKIAQLMKKLVDMYLILIMGLVIKDDLQSAPGDSYSNAVEQTNSGIMQNASSTNPTHAGKSHAFQSISATDTYKADRDEFKESKHIEELKESYSKSDEVVRLCQGKLCHKAPLIMHTFPDRRKQNALDGTSFTELFPQELEDLTKPLLKSYKNEQIKTFKENPISQFIGNKLQQHTQHSFQQHHTRLVYHKFGCIIKGQPCATHSDISDIPSNILKVPMISTPKTKQTIDDRIEFEEYKEKYLCQETLTQFGALEPFPHLEELFKRNKLKLYETEKDKIKNIKPLQPEWVHPQWSDYFQEQMNELIKTQALNRESAERWMVEHILQKSTADNWKRAKQKKVNEFISASDLLIKRELKSINKVKSKDYDEAFPVSSRLRQKMSDCAKRLSLKEVDIYDDVRQYALEEYKEATLDLIDSSSDDSSSSSSSSEEESEPHPYTPFKPLFSKAKKYEYVD